MSIRAKKETMHRILEGDSVYDIAEQIKSLRIPENEKVQVTVRTIPNTFTKKESVQEDSKTGK